MGMTFTVRQALLVGGAVVVGGLAIWVRGRGGADAPVEPFTTDNPLVVDAPRLLVSSGNDTLTVFGPTLLVYAGVPASETEPPGDFLEAAAALQATLAAAEAGLAAMGVRIIAVDEPPQPLNVAQEVDAAAGPPIPLNGVGLLLADGRGRIRRLDRTVEATTLVCLASSTLQLPPPPVFQGGCPP